MSTMQVGEEIAEGSVDGLESVRPSASERFLAWIKSNAVLSVACVFALLSCIAVPPDGAYLGYVDVKTIACLFSILAVVGAMRNLGVFQYGAKKIISRFNTCRAAVCALVGVTLVISMVATNDMALIMMLPLSAATLITAGWAKAIPFTFVMQNLAANLGGMILPFGNPQNLYLFEYFGIELDQFLLTMLMPFALSVVLIAICCYALSSPVPAATTTSKLGKAPNYRLRSKKEATQHRFMQLDGRTKRRASAFVYAALMLMVILSVFRIVPYALAAFVVVVVLGVMDRKAIQTLDYGLLLTFFFFFIFAGNMSRIPAVDVFLSRLMTEWPLFTAAGLSQVISNVPAAVLLSHFTESWNALLVGVNIGGAGTIVGSLASLITLQHYRAIRADIPEGSEGGMSTPRYIGYMTLYNMAFLIVLLVACSLWGGIA